MEAFLLVTAPAVLLCPRTAIVHSMQPASRSFEFIPHVLVPHQVMVCQYSRFVAQLTSE